MLEASQFAHIYFIVGRMAVVSVGLCVVIFCAVIPSKDLYLDVAVLFLYLYLRLFAS